jgi:hypothetical protein
VETIEVVGSRIVIKELTLHDEQAARILEDYAPEERLDVVKQGLRLGLILGRQARTVANVDFVKLEFERLQGAIEAYWKDEVVKKIDATITNYFDLNNGILPRQFAQYFGNGQDKGKLAALFDEKNTESITHHLLEILQTELTGEDSKFLKALNPDDNDKPIGRLSAKLEGRIQSLRDAVVGKKAADEMAEAGTQKGGPYEDLVFRYIDRIASAFGDKAEDVSNQNVAGDYVVTLNPETVPGHCIRLTIDAKDKSMGLKACEDTLRDAKARWTAQTAMLVFAKEESTPFQAPIGIRRLGEGHVCVFGKEDMDSRVLQAAYQVARLDAVRSVQRSIVQIEGAVVQEKLEQAVQKLHEFVTLKRRLTASISELSGIRQFVDQLHRECRERLEEAWQALGIRVAMPSSGEDIQ